MTVLVERLRREESALRASGLALMPTLLGEAADEIDRLTECLRKANEQAERFEREWYLRGDEIERLRRPIAGS